MTHSVRVDDDRLLVDGVARVLLCASLFPFRLAREEWRERLQGVRRLGYHAIDTYVPWNFHEVASGSFDFEGDHDIGHFLDLAAEADLLVVARPGPYICSEYDGGGLPAWLGTIDGLRVRQNEPLFLALVQAWFDRILPILSAHQVDRGGAVALVQLDNELDFFDCEDPGGYIGALAEMARGHDITVPLIACAGQGDIRAATGSVPGVVPTINLYPDDNSPNIERTASYYSRAVRSMGYPFLVTETNRLHRTLRRLLITGARMVGAYLQASSWNFDYMSSTGNWGRPLGLMASDYDFGGSVAADGTERPDAGSGRVLSLLIRALGSRLATATPCQALDFVQTEGQPVVPPCSLALDGGGHLTSLVNLGSSEVRGELRGLRGVLPVLLGPGCGVLLATDVPLDSVGINGTMAGAGGELIALERDGTASVVAVHAPGLTELRLGLPGGRVELSACDGLGIDQVDADTFVVRGESGLATLVDRDGARLEVHLVPTADIPTRFERATGVPTVGAPPPRRLSVQSVQLAEEIVDLAALGTASPVRDQHPRPMEYHGFYRGTAVYSCAAPAGRYAGLLLGRAADVVTVRVGEAVFPTVVNGGDDLFIPFTEGRSLEEGTPIEVRVETWGHSNFDEDRVPSLRLGSLRGISSAALISAVVDLTDGWEVESADLEPGARPSAGPYADWATWSSPVRPDARVYLRTIELAPSADAAAVRIRGSEGVHTVAVAGTHAGRITPLSNILDISAAMDGRRSAGIGISVTKSFDEAPGRVELLTGRRLTGWRVAGYSVAELARAAGACRRRAATCELPIQVEPGSPRWIFVNVKESVEAAGMTGSDIAIRPLGTGFRLTVIHNDHLIGRIWAAPAAIPVTGGRGDLALAPAPWLEPDPQVAILVEATGPGPGILREIELANGVDVIHAVPGEVGSLLITTPGLSAGLSVWSSRRSRSRPRR